MTSPSAKGIQTFMDDIEKAKALSLETLELDRLRREHRRNQRDFEDIVRNFDDAQNYRTSQQTKSIAYKNDNRNGSCDIITTNVEPRSRPKPELTILQNTKLPPPPRKQGPSLVPGGASNAPSVTEEDLMSFHGRHEASNSADVYPSLETLFLDNVSSDVAFNQPIFTHQVNNSTPPATTTIILPQQPISAPHILPYPIYGTHVPNFSHHPCLAGPLPLSQWNFPPPLPQQSNDTHLSAGHHLPPPPQRPFVMPPPIPTVPPRRAQSSLASSSTMGLVDDPLSVLKSVAKRPNSNLIDLRGYHDLGFEKFERLCVVPDFACGHDELLKNFDPLLTKIVEVVEKDGKSRNEGKSVVAVKENVIKVDPVVAVDPAPTAEPVVELRKKPPVRPRLQTTSRQSSRSSRKDGDNSAGRDSKRDNKWRGNAAINAFWDSVVKLRQEFRYDDEVTNPGCVISPVLESLREESMSMRLTIATELQEKPIAFTCDVNTSIEHIINNVVFTILDDSTVNTEEYILKVHGLEEYMTNNTVLADYEYVHCCQKFAEDVRLTLLHIAKLRRPLLRTVHDDKAITEIDAKTLYPPSKVLITQKTLDILMETLDSEILKMKEKAVKNPEEIYMQKGVTQAVKAISAVTCQVETKELKCSLEKLDSVSTKNHSDRTSSRKPSESSPINMTKANERRLLQLTNALENVKNAVNSQLHMIRAAFNVDMELPCEPSSSCKTMTEITQHIDTVLVNVAAVYRLQPFISECYDSFTLKCELYHGIRLLTEVVETPKPVSRTVLFYEHLVFDELMEFANMKIRHLPRETRLCCTLYGVRTVSSDGKETGVPTKCPLSWGAIQLFNFEGIFAQGKYLCGMWPVELDIRLGPALCNMRSDCPVLEIEIPTLNSTVIFPPLPESLPCYANQFEDLENEQKQKVMDIIARSSCSTNVISDRETLWEIRHYLFDIPHALPKVLLGAIDWDYECLYDVYSMLHKWEAMNCMDAIELLLPCFPDVEVRKMAVTWIRSMGADELCDYLPQLVEAYKYETYEDCAIAKFLLERSMTSIRVAHNLYWVLKQTLDDEMYGQRIHLLLYALLATCGKALRDRLKFQDILMEKISEIAKAVKASKDKMKTLTTSLEHVHYLLAETPTSLPLTPSFEVVGMAKDCSYFNSNTLPLKLSFKSLENGANPLEAIYKEGDDLKQDMLTIQMIRIMDKLWLKEGLDLRIVIFKCIPTGPKKGILELVKGSETLRKIHVDHGGLTGSFKEDPIADWLQRHNPTELEYNKAVENFTYSCAGYAVATYILGVCDRHNDNIMVKTSGHMFHIDFAKFLGDAQTFGTIKRDRVPFVLTSDMAYVINGGDKPSSRFQNFVDLCCQAFNIIRRNGNLFLNLFSLMVSSGIPGVTSEAVNYIQKALLPELTESEADIAFCRMIEDSLKNTFTQINFFVHNIAQWKLSREDNSNILSFTPKTYTLQTDGKITSWCVTHVEKRYEPAKHYVYTLKVTREGHADPTLLIRTYREFCEFHQKLFKLFPHAKYYSLSAGVPFGRSNIRQVAEKRKAEIEAFLKKLETMAHEIKHCDLVYTFFHPLLRDQQLENRNDLGMSDRNSANLQTRMSYGQVNLSIHYKNNTLFIMVRHAKDLSCPKGTTPDPYVKTYLLPDDAKITKQKTKVMRKNCHPTFMELLVYNKPLDIVKNKTLKVSVWDYGRMAENSFLGEVYIKLPELDLNTETVSWYQLSGNH